MVAFIWTRSSRWSTPLYTKWPKAVIARKSLFGFTYVELDSYNCMLCIHILNVRGNMVQNLLLLAEME